MEGFVGPICECVHKIIDGIIDPTNVYYFTSAVNANYLYDNFVKSHNINKRINIRSCIFWDRYVWQCGIKYPLEYNPESLKEKIFLCFNRVARSHRIALLGLMYDQDLVDKGFYSYLHATHADRHLNTIEHCVETLPYSNNIKNICKKNILSRLDQFPLKLNTEPDYNATDFMSSDIDYYRKSYFSLVTESLYLSNEKSIFFSEKIFKPIVMKHPFMIVNAPDTLKTLRNLGYKTFGSIIDEGYDHIQSHSERLVSIVNEVKRISKNEDWQWLEWQRLAKPIVYHNYEVLSEAAKKYER